MTTAVSNRMLTPRWLACDLATPRWHRRTCHPARQDRERGGRTIATTVAIRSRTGGASVWLEVTYQGLAAPTELFADLELIGWASPAIAPPPHDAIDWSRPNEA